MFRRLTAFAINRAPELDSSGLMFMSLHHDDPRVTAATKRRIDRCVVIGPRRRGEGEIGIRTVGGADFVLATHEGTERDLSGFAEWQEEFGTRVLQRSRRSGAVIEVHLDDPRKWPARGTPRLSDVLVPVEAANDLMMWYVRRGRPPSLSSLPVLPSPALEQAKQNTGKKRSQS